MTILASSRCERIPAHNPLDTFIADPTGGDPSPTEYQRSRRQFQRARKSLGCIRCITMTAGNAAAPALRYAQEIVSGKANGSRYPGREFDASLSDRARLRSTSILRRGAGAMRRAAAGGVS